MSENLICTIPPQFHDFSVEGLKVILPEDPVTRRAYEKQQRR